MFGDFVSFVSCAFATQKQFLLETKNRGERGFVLVFMSISLLVLTAVGGIAVDLGNWYYHVDKLQKAVDAASLAGAPYLPGNPSAAYAAATQVLEDNGVKLENISTQDTSPFNTVLASNPNAYSTTAYIAPDPNFPGRLNVQAGVKVHNILLGLIDVDDVWIKRGGNAEYVSKVDMGNPGNVLGAEPTWAGHPSVQDPDILAASRGVSDYWLNIAGGKSDKVNGDKYTAGLCSRTTSDGCSASGKNIDIPKQDEDNREHDYVVHVGRGVVGPITVQVFDGAFVDVGSNCDGSLSNGIDGSRNGVVLGGATLSARATANGLPSDAYEAGIGSLLCTGDAAHSLATNSSQASLSRNNPPQLEITVFNPAPEGSEDKVGSELDSHTFTTVSSNQDLASKLTKNSAASKEFRQWFTVATITRPGDYVIRAKTPAGSFGNNHFSIRAGIGTGPVWDTDNASKVTISSVGHLAVFTNAASTSSSFYFAKITAAQAGRTINFNLFDVGDAPQPVDVSLVAPRGAYGLPAGFGACVQEGPQVYTVTHATCGIAQAWSGGTAPVYNGRNVTLHVNIPLGYSCIDDGTDKCWMKFQFNTTQPARDTTTWEILDCGKPLRLLPDNAGAIQSEQCVQTPPSRGTTTTTAAPTTTTSTVRPSTTSTTRPPTSTTVRPTTTTVPTPTTVRPPVSTTVRPSTTTTTRPPTTTTVRPTTTTVPGPTPTTVISGT